MSDFEFNYSEDKMEDKEFIERRKIDKTDLLIEKFDEFRAEIKKDIEQLNFIMGNLKDKNNDNFAEIKLLRADVTRLENDYKEFKSTCDKKNSSNDIAIIKNELGIFKWIGGIAFVTSLGAILTAVFKLILK